METLDIKPCPNPECPDEGAAPMLTDNGGQVYCPRCGMRGPMSGSPVRRWNELHRAAPAPTQAGEWDDRCIALKQ